MLFKKFDYQKKGGSFFEIQFCKRPPETAIEELVNIIKFRQGDSLYVHIDDDIVFYREYSGVFDCGTYANLQTGTIDLWGINYYAPSLLEPMIEKLQKEKPLDYEVLLAWLHEARKYNGFYILGL